MASLIRPPITQLEPRPETTVFSYLDFPEQDTLFQTCHHFRGCWLQKNRENELKLKLVKYYTELFNHFGSKDLEGDTTYFRTKKYVCTKLSIDLNEWMWMTDPQYQQHHLSLIRQNYKQYLDTYVRTELTRNFEPELLPSRYLSPFITAKKIGLSLGLRNSKQAFLSYESSPYYTNFDLIGNHCLKSQCINPNIGEYLANIFKKTISHFDNTSTLIALIQTKTEPVILMGGWKTHSMVLVFKDDYLGICNAGAEAHLDLQNEKNVLIPYFKIDVNRVTPEVIEKIKKIKTSNLRVHARYFYDTELPSLLGGRLRMHPTLTFPAQTVRNCGFHSAACAFHLLSHLVDPANSSSITTDKFLTEFSTRQFEKFLSKRPFLLHPAYDPQFIDRVHLKLNKKLIQWRKAGNLDIKEWTDQWESRFPRALNGFKAALFPRKKKKGKAALPQD